MSAALTMTVRQLMLALDFASLALGTREDRLVDPEAEITFQVVAGDATPGSAAGLYAWFAEHPEAGSALLGEDEVVKIDAPPHTEASGN